jgi:hypothetical protein
VGLWMVLFPALRRVDRFTDVEIRHDLARARFGAAGQIARAAPKAT